MAPAQRRTAVKKGDHARLDRFRPLVFGHDGCREGIAVVTDEPALPPRNGLEIK